MRSQPIRETGKITRAFNSDIKQYDKRSIANVRRDQVISKGDPLPPPGLCA